MVFTTLKVKKTSRIEQDRLFKTSQMAERFHRDLNRRSLINNQEKQLIIILSIVQ